MGVGISTAGGKVEKAHQPELVNEIVVRIYERLSRSFIEGVRELIDGADKDATLSTTPINHVGEMSYGALDLTIHEDKAKYDYFLKTVLASQINGVSSGYRENAIQIVLSGPIYRVISEIPKLTSPDRKGAAIQALAEACGLAPLAEAPELREHTGKDYPESHPLHGEVRKVLGELWSQRLKMSGLSK
jgi:hypothetical protein